MVAGHASARPKTGRCTHAKSPAAPPEGLETRVNQPACRAGDAAAQVIPAGTCRVERPRCQCPPPVPRKRKRCDAHTPMRYRRPSTAAHAQARQATTSTASSRRTLPENIVLVGNAPMPLVKATPGGSSTTPRAVTSADCSQPQMSQERSAHRVTSAPRDVHGDFGKTAPHQVQK